MTSILKVLVDKPKEKYISMSFKTHILFLNNLCFTCTLKGSSIKKLQGHLHYRIFFGTARIKTVRVPKEHFGTDEFHSVNASIVLHFHRCRTKMLLVLGPCEEVVQKRKKWYGKGSWSSVNSYRAKILPNRALSISTISF